MGRSYPAERARQHHQGGARVEPAREEERAPQAHLKEDLAQRDCGRT